MTILYSFTGPSFLADVSNRIGIVTDLSNCTTKIAQVELLDIYNWKIQLLKAKGKQHIWVYLRLCPPRTPTILRQSGMVASLSCSHILRFVLEWDEVGDGRIFIISVDSTNACPIEELYPFSTKLSSVASWVEKLVSTIILVWKLMNVKFRPCVNKPTLLVCTLP